MKGLTYAYYKTIVVIIRFLSDVIGFVVRRPSPTPDEVLHIPSRDAGRTIKAHLYHSSSAASGPKPVLLNFHGSGFMLPQHGTDDEFCRRVSRATKYTVVDCSYRLAPESPFPAALNDVEDAVRYILSRPEEYDASHLSIGGFSAGGNLSLAASACLFPPDTFRSLIAFYPALDLSSPANSKIAPNPNGMPIPAPLARLFNTCYVHSGFDRRDPRISPRFAELERFPRRMLVITADCDTLALEAEELATKLQQRQGWHVVCERMESCNHGWDKHTRAGSPQHQAKERAYGLAIDLLNE
ncbi:hypothetical protein N7509_005171 [Penicillium cosmopolitanum]|uniref:Alpha/beta hydrolase fold-3 domain-containing protein n=1 Tax=Penicillium cosmopolitanum TaxID=1131564 RepID=A0A9W9W1N6_9EURO|nr:uncharacterized protein N7509_005171 [Penicillium cosmopolitanum]KAJ5397058.1 hypothetical protein N7509_005171 [Penicillium cosmopolitanum]